MEYEICLEPSGIRFMADERQNIVEAAKQHGISIKHGCASGSCGDCKGTILSGASEQGPFMPLLLLPTERAAGLDELDIDSHLLLLLPVEPWILTSEKRPTFCSLSGCRCAFLDFGQVWLGHAALRVIADNGGGALPGMP